MKRILIIAFSMCLSCLAADQPSFPELPDSASKLIDTLKSSGAGYTVLRPRLDYVKESDLPYLIGLLDSKSLADMWISLPVQSIAPARARWDTKLRT